MNEIDARGLSCPAPVLLTKDSIEKNKPEQIRIILDNEPAKENVSRFLSSKNFNVTAHKAGNDIIVTGTLQEGGITEGNDVPISCDAPVRPKAGNLKKIMIMISTKCMGHGDDELGTKLMVNFIKTLNEIGQELWRLVFVNSGVKLTVEGSSVLTELKNLEKDGIQILVCGTCLDHFALLDKKQVGETTNMLDIVTSMQLADQVINF